MAHADDAVSRSIKEVLSRNCEAFTNNFEVNSALSQLCREHIISDDQYKQCAQEKNRKVQRQRVLELLLHKEGSDWIEPFKQILQDIGQTWLISAPEAQITDDVNFHIGNTRILSDAEEVFIHINIPMAYQSEEADIIARLVSDNEMIQQSIDLGVLDIRDGHSIFIHMRPYALSSSFEMVIFENIRKWLDLIYKKQLLPANKLIEIDVYKKPRVFYFDDFFGKSKNNNNRTKNSNYCNGCIRATIMKNEEEVLDQIESDIIMDTFKGLDTVSEYIKTVCCDKSRTRVLRANMFLIFAVQNEVVLKTFYEIMKEKRLMDFNLIKCRQCSGEGDESAIKQHIPTKKPFRSFTFKNGQLLNISEDDREIELNNILVSEKVNRGDKTTELM